MRPVSERGGREVSEYERLFGDGSGPRVLDIIDVPVVKRCPFRHQAEIWLLDKEFYWEKAGAYSPFDLPILAEPVDVLWVDVYSTYDGLDDKIPIEAAGKRATDLRRIAAEEIAP
ncbi:MAG: hypothetical protein OXI01_03665 [Albidovulum sp.]|nr:hypothetical protein [Albidovulum sp.]